MQGANIVSGPSSGPDTKRRPRKFFYSVKTLYTLLVLSFSLISVGILVSISSYFNNQLLQSRYENVTELLSVYNAQLSEDFESTVTYLFQTSAHNTDIAMLNASTDAMTQSLCRIRILKLLTESLPAYPRLDGMFFYSPISDDFIYASAYGNSDTCATFAKELLRSNRARLRDGVINYTQWHICRTEDSTCLIRFVISGDAITGAWVSLDHLTNRLENALEYEVSVFYTDETGHIIGASETSPFVDFAVSEEGNSGNLYTAPSTSTEYLAIVNSLDYCSSYMVAFIPLDNIVQKMAPIYSKLVMIIFFLLLILAAAVVLYRKLFSIPSESFQKILRELHENGQDPQISMTPTHCIEVMEINAQFNRLLENIHQLRISIYEEQLAKDQIELRYLKAQISPHFLVNCLSCFSALVSGCDKHEENRELLQKMMRALSNHIRYTLSARSRISLEEEVHYVDNYLSLVSMRYPGCLHYEISIADQANHSTVFPMLLLMFTENTIKHNMVMGEDLRIKISGCLEEIDGKQRIHLIHIDSGSGFSDKDLEDLPALFYRSANSVCQDGHGIGMYNIVQTLRLVYHDQAEIRFSNEKDWGARIDIFIPYIPYSPAEET